MTRHLSSFDLDAVALGAEPSDPAKHAHLASCALCRTRADEGHALRAELPASLRSRTFAAIQRRKKRFAVVVSIAVPLLVAAAVLLVVQVREPDTAAVPELAIKGTPALQVYARHEQRVFQVTDGQLLAAGDEIRFAVTPAGATYVLIASVDGRGQATIYVPYAGERSIPVDPRGRTELPGSIILDDATGPERLFAVFSTSPIRTADVLPALQKLVAAGPKALRDSMRLDLRVPATQASFVFEKAAP